LVALGAILCKKRAKKKTGINVDEYGNKIEENVEENGELKMLSNIPSDPNDFMLNNKSQDFKLKQPKKEYTPIKSYKPSGSLIYDDDLLNKIEGKFFK